MAANSGDLEENLRINVNIHYRGILGILVKRIDTKGYLVRKVEDVSPFFTALKIGDIITHWDKIPLHNVSFDKYNELVEVSQKNGKFALLLKRYTKQKPKDKNQETNNKDEAGETQTETAPVPAPNLPSSSGVTAAGKDGNDNAVLDKIVIASDQIMLEDTPLIQHTTDKISFYESLEELKQYEKQHGHVNVDEASNPKLYNWCVSMRSLRRFPKLQPPDAITSPETQPDNRGDGPAFNEYFIKELEELNFDWDPDKCDTHHISRREDKSNSTFNVHLEELKKFKKVHGHTNPNGKTDRALYNWCAIIRFAHRSRQRGENKGRKLPEDYIYRLEEIGFLFDTESASKEKHSTHAEDKSNSTFNLHLEKLRKFKKVHGHTNPNYKNDKALNSWCGSIVRSYKDMKRGEPPGLKLASKGMKLDEDRIRRLEEIGYKSIHGHCNVTAKNDGKIGRWAANIRSTYRSKQRGGINGMKLSEDRIDRLEEIGKTRNLRNTQEEKKGYEFYLNITKRTACEDEEESAVTKWADLSIEEQTCYNELAYFEVKRLESKKSFDIQVSEAEVREEISGQGEKYPNFPSQEWSNLKTPALWDLPEDWKVEDGNVGLIFESPNGASFVSHKKAAMYAKRMKEKAGKNHPINLSAEVYPLGTNIIKPAEQYLYKGKVSAITKNAIKPYHVIYNNGEEEDFTEDEIKEIICDKQSGEIAQEAEIEKLFPIAYEGKVVGIPSGRSTHYDVCLANNGQIERVQSGHLEKWVELHELHKNEGIML
eukprot:scaffold4020_cov234-Chaetoceros_neogracile.AAC.10